MVLSRDALARRITDLGPWFHNMELGGIRTAPDHFLGDYPAVKWRHMVEKLPADLAGRSVLDIGCNGGFYALAMKRLGAAHVLGIDEDPFYLEQARFAAETTGLAVEFRQMSVYDVAAIGERFDLVLFMGVLYHLRHPLLALDLIREHVASDLLVFQSLQRGAEDIVKVPHDRPIAERALFDAPGYPKLHFVEHRYSNDPTNWWVPNRACTEAMLRASGFAIVDRIEDETYLCAATNPPIQSAAVYPARGGAAP